MGKGGNAQHRTYTWNEVEEHTKLDDRWIVIENKIYDVSRFQKKHPGGAKIIGHFAGQDATVSCLEIFFVEIFHTLFDSFCMITMFLKQMFITYCSVKHWESTCSDYFVRH